MTVNPVKSAKGHPRRMGKPSREVIVGSYFRIPAIRRRKKLSIGSSTDGWNKTRIFYVKRFYLVSSGKE